MRSSIKKESKYYVLRTPSPKSKHRRLSILRATTGLTGKTSYETLKLPAMDAINTLLMAEKVSLEDAIKNAQAVRPDLDKRSETFKRGARSIASVNQNRSR